MVFETETANSINNKISINYQSAIVYVNTRRSA